MHELVVIIPSPFLPSWNLSKDVIFGASFDCNHCICLVYNTAVVSRHKVPCLPNHSKLLANFLQISSFSLHRLRNHDTEDMCCLGFFVKCAHSTATEKVHVSKGTNLKKKNEKYKFGLDSMQGYFPSSFFVMHIAA